MSSFRARTSHFHFFCGRMSSVKVGQGICTSFVILQLLQAIWAYKCKSQGMRLLWLGLRSMTLPSSQLSLPFASCAVLSQSAWPQPQLLCSCIRLWRQEWWLLQGLLSPVSPVLLAAGTWSPFCTESM